MKKKEMFRRGGGQGFIFVLDDENEWLCPVCAVCLEGEYPWGVNRDEGFGSHDICPTCHIEYGCEDNDPTCDSLNVLWERYRRDWIASGEATEVDLERIRAVFGHDAV